MSNILFLVHCVEASIKHDSLDYGIMLGMTKLHDRIDQDLWAIERNIIIEYIASYTKQIL